MNNKSLYATLGGALLLCFTAFFSSCVKDNSGTGAMRLEMTDSPIEDASVKSVFVTVADVKIDGRSWSGFSGKTTFDLLAYQNGQTKMLGDGAIAADSYSKIVLVLDTETDANGNSPGCYVLDKQNVKHPLEGGASKEITVNGAFSISDQQTQNLVLDFDLRKSLGYKANSTTDYVFATDAELTSAMRLFVRSETGTIKGSCNDVVSGSDKIVVYAYKKGTYDVNTEKQGQGSTNIQFKNALNSAAVASDGSFQLSFMQKGDYELHFISYQDSNNDGVEEAKGELAVTLNSELNLLGLTLGADQTLNLTILVTGIIGF